MVTVGTDEPLGVAVIDAIHRGDLDVLSTLLREHPDLASARLGANGPGREARSLLHIVTDWPGHYPNGAAIVAMLVDAGADVGARFVGRHTETPLHWAASSDDVEVLDALLDAGADIDAPGSVIGGGTPLSDAAAFGQWRTARRLIERGAQPTLPEAAALGLMHAVEERFGEATQPGPEEVTNAFWYACHGGQRGPAEFLLDRGAELNWLGHDGRTPFDAARSSGANALVAWLHHRGGLSAGELGTGVTFDGATPARTEPNNEGQRHPPGGGVVSTMMAVLLMAALGALLWWGFELIR